MRIWQNGRKSSISYDREFGKKYDGNLVLYKYLADDWINTLDGELETQAAVRRTQQ
jgi:hypothetical protein